MLLLSATVELVFAIARHIAEITDICRSAKLELELEVELKTIEEQWTEQVSKYFRIVHGELSRGSCIGEDYIPRVSLAISCYLYNIAR